MNLFDISRAPLEGVNLIEASAGTGKTYAIEGLYIRLLLEKQLTLDQILVVTFTRAATEELKTRIRQKLVLANAAFTSGVCQEPFIGELCARIKDHRHAAGLLQNALINFDKAAIFTIHGFCQRILAESAFETRNLFEFEVVTDMSGLLNEIADDFWRIHFYSAPVELVSYGLKQLSGPDYFYRLSAKAVRPNLLAFPQIKRPDMKSMDDYRRLFSEMATAWEAGAREILLLLKDPALNGKVYGSTKPAPEYPDVSKRDAAILSLGNSMDRLVADNSPGFPLFKKFELFTRTKLSDAGKKNQTPPHHPFFDLCDKLTEKAKMLEAEMDDFLVFLKSEFFRYVANCLAGRKKKSNMIGFDDMLIMVKRAFDLQGGQDLVKKIRQIYKAALVDEFQDTDAVQYEIFSRLFGCGDDALFMIGDPKQAIYSFRGADIFSYMEAAYHVKNPYTLLKNFRSDPPLIEAVNGIFSSHHRPFFFESIAFGKAQSANPGKAETSAGSSGLIIWHLFSDPLIERDVPIPKSHAMQRASQAIAAEIISLASPGKNSVQFGDIAILVRTNRQAKLIKSRLSKQNIPCVLYQTGNIFSTDEALDMKRILWGIAEPGDKRRMTAAMSTDLVGVNGIELDMKRSSMTVENKITSIKTYSAIWKTEGFMRMFRRLMAEEHIKQRLMKYPDGERRLTNLLHLSEILHQAEIENSLGMLGLVKWLANKITSFPFDSEEHLIRLENDARAVTIMTLHKSKGLEFPIVFCPFPWDESEVREKEVEFHDPSQNNRPAIDLGSERFEENKKIAEKERLAENLRLFYVSLTRAKNKCYIVWGRIKGGETSAPAYLFHCAGDGADPLAELKNTFSLKSDAALINDLNVLSERSHGTIRLAALPSHTDTQTLFKSIEGRNFSPREFSGAISNAFRIASYSSLSAGKTEANDLFDNYWDAGTPAAANDLEHDNHNTDIGQDFSDISGFPKGTRSGLFFHSVFENIEFDSFIKNPDQYAIARQLNTHGFDPAWEKEVIRTISNVLSTPLNTSEGNIRLCSVKRENRLNEMDFYFPIKKISPGALSSIFAPFGRQKFFDGYHNALERLTFAPLEGFMKGFIDLVFFHENRFYIIDWKSNRLGPARSDYHQGKIHEVMMTHHYILQYHLYALALHCYLTKRVSSYQYIKNFGGVFYLFIRGINPADQQSAGIYFDLPDPELIEHLRESLTPDTGSESLK